MSVTPPEDDYDPMDDVPDDELPIKLKPVKDWELDLIDEEEVPYLDLSDFQRKYLEKRFAAEEAGTFEPDPQWYQRGISSPEDYIPALHEYFAIRANPPKGAKPK